MNDSVFERLERLLRECGVAFDVSRHAAVFTSEEAAKVRGTDLGSGAKALLCKADGRFMMFVLPADRRLASKQVRKSRKIKSLRFASGDEVLKLTGLRPGSIPPFGSLFDLPTFCDHGLGEHPSINFNAGDHTISIAMSYEAFLQVEQPELGDFAE